MENILRIKEKVIQKNIEVNETITIEQIEIFEKQHNINLPNELVLFYTIVGNGCTIDREKLRGLDDLKFAKESVNKEFEFDEYWVWEDDEEDPDWERMDRGNIELMDIGDSQTWNLIITGKEKGQMWFFTCVGIQPCAPKMNFLEWFEFWLDGGDDYFAEFEY